MLESTGLESCGVLKYHRIQSSKVIILQSKHLKSNIANHQVAEKIIGIFPVPASCSVKWKSLATFFDQCQYMIHDWWEANIDTSIFYTMCSKRMMLFWHFYLHLFSWK